MSTQCYKINCNVKSWKLKINNKPTHTWLQQTHSTRAYAAIGAQSRRAQNPGSGTRSQRCCPSLQLIRLPQWIPKMWAQKEQRQQQISNRLQLKTVTTKDSRHISGRILSDDLLPRYIGRELPVEIRHLCLLSVGTVYVQCSALNFDKCCAAYESCADLWMCVRINRLTERTGGGASDAISVHSFLQFCKYIDVTGRWCHLDRQGMLAGNLKWLCEKKNRSSNWFYN